MKDFYTPAHPVVQSSTPVSTPHPVASTTVLVNPRGGAMSIKMPKFCTDCRWYLFNGICTHPTALDLVTGNGGDAHEERYADSEAYPEACGKEAVYYERREDV